MLYPPRKAGPNGFYSVFSQSEHPIDQWEAVPDGYVLARLADHGDAITLNPTALPIKLVLGSLSTDPRLVAASKRLLLRAWYSPDNRLAWHISDEARPQLHVTLSTDEQPYRVGRVNGDLFPIESAGIHNLVSREHALLMASPSELAICHTSTINNTFIMAPEAAVRGVWPAVGQQAQ
jgi:hypothetical protein